MGLDEVKRALFSELAKNYQRGSKREKGLVLEELVGFTGYNRFNRAQVWTFQALERLPFPLLGRDSDNEGAFINEHLVRSSQENNLTFTPNCPYRKNE